MKLLMVIFVVLACWGFVTGHLGGAVLALFMAGFVAWADHWFAVKDQEWLRSPDGAQKPPSTEQVLDQHGSEASRSKF